MREYQSAGVLITAANGNYTFANTASNDFLHSSSDSEMRSPLSTDSHFSLLTAASSTLSIVSQTHQCDWPEFQESYNSIMDNTNLLDSCAAALNEISGEDGISKSDRVPFNRSLSSTTTNSSLSGNDLENRVTSKCLERFTRWLCEMENRIAAQPKLSKIVAMQPKQMAMQLEVHSKIFKEIIAQPCIVKGSKRNEYKSIEERYHLLYLKVYEVLLLLEGLPANSFSPSNRILSESFHDYDSSLSTDDKEQSYDHVDVDGDSNEFLNDAICDKNVAEVKTPIYTETSVLSTSIGTYYFNYDDTVEQQTDNTTNEKLSSTIFEHIGDKELTFENDLHTLFNATDSICLKSPDQTLVSEPTNAQQYELTDDTVVVTPNSAQIWNKIDFCQLAAPPVATSADNYLAQDIDLAHYNKVYDWLHSKTSKSTVSLDCSTASEADYQLLYRAKSEMDLPAIRSLESNNRTSPLRTSLNCLSLAVSPIKHYDAALSDTVTEDSSLLWDNFQIGEFKSDNEFGLIGSDFETKELVNKVCYFGDDYSEHFTPNPNELSTTESEKGFDTGFGQSLNAKIDSNVIETSSPLISTSTKTKRSRRIRKKRTRNNSIATTSSEYSTMDHSSETGQSEATTASASSKLLKSTQVKKTANDAKSDDAMNTETKQSCDEFVPEKTISYNSNEKQFELHSKESTESKKMKISEMKISDFHDIVQMCQNNIDCLITVLGADPNRVLTVDYCQQMKNERYQKSNSETCKCKHENANASDPMCNTNSTNIGSSRTKDTGCSCNHAVQKESANTCVCAWVSHTIAMILNFLIDCWNVFRNMKLYTYLCRVTKALFGSTRQVADHLKSKSQMLNAKAIKYA